MCTACPFAARKLVEPASLASSGPDWAEKSNNWVWVYTVLEKTQHFQERIQLSASADASAACGFTEEQTHFVWNFVIHKKRCNMEHSTADWDATVLELRNALSQLLSLIVLQALGVVMTAVTTFVASISVYLSR